MKRMITKVRFLRAIVLIKITINRLIYNNIKKKKIKKNK